jgi:hypothetical protein
LVKLCPSNSLLIEKDIRRDAKPTAALGRGQRQFGRRRLRVLLNPASVRRRTCPQTFDHLPISLRRSRHEAPALH